MSSAPARSRDWRPHWPCPVALILAQHRRGPGDPTYLVDPQRRHWRGIGTPEGPATLVVEPLSGAGEVRAQAWGPGADWVLTGLPDLLGAGDDVAGFEPQHPVLATAWRRHEHHRFSRSGRVLEALVPSILEQKVTGKEAFGAFRALVRRHGEPAPGPGADRGLRLQPAAERLRRIPSWEWLAMGVDPARSRAVVTVAGVAEAWDRTGDLASPEADRRLRSIPGVGVWTSAEVRQRSHGDPDAVSFGDYHVAKDVGWALTGTPFDDDELAHYLAPWRPHRARVVALLALEGHHRPRRGPRMPVRTHLPG